MPPEARPVAVRVQPPTIAVAMGAKQVRVASRVVDRLVHRHQPPETHCLKFLVRELLAEEAGNFRMRGSVTTTGSHFAKVRSNPFLVLELHPLDDRDTMVDASGGNEGRASQNLLGVIAQAEILLLETSDP